MKSYWTILRSHRRPIRFLAANLLVTTGACRIFSIRQRGYRLKFHPSNLATQLWIDPRQRVDSLVFFQDYLKSGDVVVDVGANIGDTVLTAALKVGATGHVVGIEAHPRTFRFLEENVRMNGVGNITVVNSAVGASSGTVRFSDDRRDDMNRIDGGDLEVSVAQLDSLVRNPGPIALLKIDVEGYEKFVLDGASNVLSRTACVHIEVSALHFRRFGYSTQDVLGRLHSEGFQLFRLVEPNGLAAVTAAFDPESFENVVALRDVSTFLARTGWSLP